MRKYLSSALCATSLLIAGVGVIALPVPAIAQADMRIGFDFFHNRLAHDGRWIRHPIWGDVWRPRPALAGADFQPYTNGYWEYTDDYGWYWVSNDPFDDVVYHYGRWVYDPQWHWLWVPGYTWSPAWVVWREGDEYTGWMPMPPDEEFISGAGLGFGVNIGPIGINFYNRWYGGRVDPDRFFVFVGNRNLVNRDYRRFVVPRDRVKVIIKRTRPITKFEVVNNRVVNRGIDVRVVERATGRRITPVPAKTVIKPNAVITTVSEAKQIRQRERAAHPIDANAVRRGKAAGGATDVENGPGEPGTRGGKAPPQTGATAPGGQSEGRRGRGNNNPAGTAGPETTAPGAASPAGSAEGSRMRNPSGESMSGPSSANPNRIRTRGGAPGNPGQSQETGGPDQTGAAPSATPETQTPRRHRPGGTTAGPDQANPNAPGASPAGGSESPSGNAPRRRGGNAGGMNGPNSTMGAGNGAGPADNGTMSGPTPGKQKAQPVQPGSADADQKKKRKPKPPSEEQPASPQ